MEITKTCTGCMACLNICPQQCISVGKNEYGETIPIIDEKKCIKCNMCKKKCPQNNELQLTYPQKCYASWVIDKEERNSSTSGGIAAGLANNYIKNNGVVYGSYFQDLYLSFHRATSLKEAKKFKGSKYTQSLTGDIFASVKKDLSENKEVLFVGTPCQISGLKMYLQKDYSNLLLVDLICHGVPSNDHLKQHIKSISNIMPDEISFRNKENYCLKLTKDGHTIYQKTNKKDKYLYAFLNSLNLRDCCYTCKYAKPIRISDITIGDFWGIGSFEEFNYPKDKVSVMLINTINGKEKLEKYGESIKLIERPITEAIIGNGNLQYHSQKDKFTDEFKKLYVNYGFEKAFDLCGISKRMILDNLPKVLSKPIRFIKNKANK